MIYSYVPVFYFNFAEIKNTKGYDKSFFIQVGSLVLF